MNVFRTVFCLFLVPFWLLAQKPLEMSIVANSAKEEPGELVSKEIRDANGVTTAGLIIFSDLKGLTFQSYNGVVKVNSSPGKDFLFLSPDERVVEVYCFGYTPLKIILNEQGVKLKSGQTWSLKITGEKKVELIPVNILVDQADARITIDGVAKGNQKTHQLSPGKHGIRIEKAGYNTVTDSIDVSLTNSLFNFTLPEVDMVGITINSVPNEAKIFINEVEKGETNRGIFLYPGKYTLRLSKGGYSDTTIALQISENGKKEWTVSMSKNTGLFTYTVTPTDATVLLNKENVTGKTQIDLTPGTYKVEISRENYYPFSEVIEIGKNKGADKTYALKPKVGTFQFSASPSGSTAQLIQGTTVVKQWSGLTRFKDLIIGTYTLSVTLSGYDPVTKVISIRENETTVEDVVLKKAVFGSLTVSASPRTASLSLYQDGKYIKALTSDQTETGLRPGSYTVKASAYGYEADEYSVTITEGRTTTKDVSLTEVTRRDPRDETLFSLHALYSIDGEPKGGSMWELGYQVHTEFDDDGIFCFEYSNGIFSDKVKKEQGGVTIEQSWGGMSFGFGLTLGPGNTSFIEGFYKYDMQIHFSGTEKVSYLTTTNETEMTNDFYSSRWTYGVNLFFSNSVMLKAGLYSMGDLYEDDDSKLGNMNDLTGKPITKVDKRNGYFADLYIYF